MTKNFYLIEEIEKLVQQIQLDYQEGIDFEILGRKKEWEFGSMKILSPCLKKFCREKFNFPNVIDYLDYHKKYQTGNSFYYRMSVKDNDRLEWDGKWMHQGETAEYDKPKKCAVCNELTSQENGQMWLWDREKVENELISISNIIAYLHPNCSEKYFANPERITKFSNCNKCQIEYKKTKSWYLAPFKDSKRKTGFSPGINLDFFCGGCWKTEEKNYRQITSDKKETVHKLEPQKSNLGDEHYYYFENNKWSSLESGTPDPDLEKDDDKITINPNNANKTSPSLAKVLDKDELIITLLIQFFKSNDIKRVVLNSKDNLTIEYESNKISENNNQLITQNIDSHELTNNQELQEVINYCQKTGKNSLSQQELEKLKNNENTSPSASKNSYIFGAIAIFSTIIAITVLIVIKNRKKGIIFKSKA